MTHAGYIIAAYIAAALVIGGLTVWILADYRAQLKKLRRLEAGGVTRRSAGGRIPGDAA